MIAYHKEANVRLKPLSLLAGLVSASGSWAEAPTPCLMSQGWTQAICKAWNDTPALSTALAQSGWAKNDRGRGVKVLQLYRKDCKGGPRAELRIAAQDGKAWCVYGGKAETEALDPAVDYVMSADTKYWDQIGRGKYKFPTALSEGYLDLQGPQDEALANVNAFNSLMSLIFNVSSCVSTCPE